MGEGDCPSGWIPYQPCTNPPSEKFFTAGRMLFITRQSLWLERWHLGRYVGRLETTGACRTPADFQPACTSPPACSSSPWPRWLVHSPVHLSPLVNTGAMLPIRCHCHHNPGCWGHREEFSHHPGELFYFLLFPPPSAILFWLDVCFPEASGNLWGFFWSRRPFITSRSEDRKVMDPCC